MLDGCEPGQVAVKRPRAFACIITLKPAQTLGLTMPPHVLLQATEVI
jgi:hypothetical protein